MDGALDTFLEEVGKALILNVNTTFFNFIVEIIGVDFFNTEQDRKDIVLRHRIIFQAFLTAVVKIRCRLHAAAHCYLERFAHRVNVLICV